MLSLRKMFAIIFGSLLIACGINFFLMPNKVLDGGVIGLALIANYLFDTKVGFVLFLCSIPIFAYTWVRDRSLFFHSLYGMLFLSYFVDLLDSRRPYAAVMMSHPFLASVLGGICIGIGFGIMLRNNTSTGGIDLLAKLLARQMGLNVGILILFMDAVVVIIGGVLFSAETFFLSLASIGVGGLATSVVTVKYFSY
ncbi:hypothetical protein SD71_19345 [Cohnella kolymensis]|uniref:YitT family protein n=1 Tax=Cohnella kolymensis TaxID=1590652 RepID=A0ABR5A0Q7_9BACL|nr:hypothetical protein SD71_19345 [Cohnella kolymensis]